MAEAAPNYRQHEDFWKPLPGPRPQRSAAPELASTHCPHCQVSLPPEAKYCQACGFEQNRTATRDLAFLATTLGHTLASLVALALGCSCLIAAIATGFVFKVSRLSDWQAVQLWRIEWLLGAIAFFLAAIVLKRLPAKP
jgi:predicted nucleic acid-binding Zn ribbon protein